MHYRLQSNKSQDCQSLSGGGGSRIIVWMQGRLRGHYEIDRRIGNIQQIAGVVSFTSRVSMSSGSASGTLMDMDFIDYWRLIAPVCPGVSEENFNLFNKAFLAALTNIGDGNMTSLMALMRNSLQLISCDDMLGARMTRPKEKPLTLGRIKRALMEA